MSDPVETARDAWGPEPPDWVRALAEACAATSQSKVAKRIGLSTTVVSQTLRCKYPGKMDNVEEAVRGRLMGALVDCPALGQLPLAECRQWREKSEAFVGTNTLRVWMYRACIRCPMNRKETGE